MSLHLSVKGYKRAGVTSFAVEARHAVPLRKAALAESGGPAGRQKDA